MTLRLRFALPRADFRVEIDLELPGEGVTAIFGASGSGKTSMLRCVAGLERPAPGFVQVAGDTWQDDAAGVFLPPWRREVGYVFQEASLFTHLDVRGNIEFGRRRAGAAAGRVPLEAAIELLGIQDLLPRRVDSLSGGERQRVAIARAVACGPRVLLLDEPLASLDPARRQEVLPWLQDLQRDLKLPLLYVTHSLDEVARLADTAVVLDRGQVKASGPAPEVLARADASRLFGDDASALLHGRIARRDEAWSLCAVDFDGGTLWLRDSGIPMGQRVRLRVLARDVSIALAPPTGTSIQNVLRASVESVTPDLHPSQVTVRLQCGDAPLLARITARAAHDLGLRPQQAVWAQVKSVAVTG